jgi:hypothetical protein
VCICAFEWKCDEKESNGKRVECDERGKGSRLVMLGSEEDEREKISVSIGVGGEKCHPTVVSFHL